MADSWVVWTYVNTTPPSSLHPPPCCSESPVASLLPDVVSRCGLERVRRIREAEAATQLLAFPPPSFSNGACPVHSLPCLPFTTGSGYQGPRGTGGWINKYQLGINLSQTDASLFMLERAYNWGSGELSDISVLSSPSGSRRRK